MRRDRRDAHAADRHAAAEAREDRVRGIAAVRLELGAKNGGISLPVTIFDFLASAMFTALEFGMPKPTCPGSRRCRRWRLVVRVADVVAVHVAHEDDVDLAEARVGRAGDTAAGVVQDARAVRVLEDQRAVLCAELAVEAA
jgi:hypothetical protein